MLIAFLMVLAVAAGSWVLLRPYGAATARLVVDVTGLPEGSAGQVKVVGPDGFRRTVERTETLDVSPGDYVVRVEQARLPDAVTYAADDEVRVSVQPEATVTVEAAYKILIPDRTKILNSERPGLLSSPTEAQLVFDPDISGLVELRTGDMLVAAEGPQTPTLLVRKVVSVKHEDGRLLVDTSPAGLEEAIPRGVIRFEDPPEAPRFWTNRKKETEVLLEIDTWKNRLGSCGTSAPRINYRVDDFEPSLKGTELEWSTVPWNQYIEMTAKASVRYAARVGVEGGAGGRCTHDDEIKLAKMPPKLIKILAKILRVGRVSFTGSMNLLFTAEVETSSGIDVQWTEQADFAWEATARTGRGRDSGTRFSGWPATFSVAQPSQVGSEAVISLKVGFRLRFAGGDPLNFIQGGPRIDLTDGAEYRIGSRDGPELNQLYTVSIAASYKIAGWKPSLGIAEWDRRARVWSSSAAPRSSVDPTRIPPTLQLPSIIDTLSVGNLPMGVVVSPDGRRAYITHTTLGTEPFRVTGCGSV